MLKFRLEGESYVTQGDTKVFVFSSVFFDNFQGNLCLLPKLSLDIGVYCACT